MNIDVNLTSWKNRLEIEVSGSDGFAMTTGRGGNYGTQSAEYVNRWFWNGTDQRMQETYGDVDHSFDRETLAFLDWIETGSRDGVLSQSEDAVAALTPSSKTSTPWRAGPRDRRGIRRDHAAEACALVDVDRPRVSFVIPASNEELTIGESVDWCLEGLRRAGVAGEVLIVDSSSDRTAEIALEHGARVLVAPNPAGLGRA